MFVDDPGDKGRLLTAGLHNSMGYFRDDTPLMELILDENGRRNWTASGWISTPLPSCRSGCTRSSSSMSAPKSGTITDPEFNFARAEDPNSRSDANIKQLGDLYMAKAIRNGGQARCAQGDRRPFQMGLRPYPRH